MWLADQSQTTAAANTLMANSAITGGGQIFAGAALNLLFNNPLTDSRTPDIIQTPDYGVIYTGKMKKVEEHGGFAHEDTNVMLVVSNPALKALTITEPVQTAQIAPTILRALGLQPSRLQAVQQEGTSVLPGTIVTTH
jgi:hypothetical protein